MCRIGKYNLSTPIIQGGMGIGVSLGRLAGAVAKEGGMGVISTVNPGYREDDFSTNPLEANLRALKNEIEYAIKESKGNGIVAINAMVATSNYEASIKTAIESGIHAIISGAGLPINLPAFTKGTSVAIAPIVSSGKAIKLILKAWDKNHHVIPDFIVIEGPQAGGHLGFKKKDLVDGNVQSLDEILRDVLIEIMPYEKEYGRRIPVFVAGGVFDGNDMARLVSKGASGVQIATRFIATEECDASIEYKQMMINAKPEDAVLVPSPVGLPGRALNTPLIKRLINGIALSPKPCNMCVKTCPKNTDIPYCISRALIEAVKGNVEDGLFFCGANVGRINKMTTVHDLIQEIMGEYNLYSSRISRNPA